MPIYEFLCPSCGRTIDRLLKKPQKTIRSFCTKTQKDVTMKRIFSPTPGIVKNPAVPRRTK